MKEVKRVVFCLFHYGYTELEWVMPLLHSYKLRNVNITVLLPCKASNSRQKLMLEWVKTYSDHILYGSDAWKRSWLLRIKYLIITSKKNYFIDNIRRVLKFLLYRAAAVTKISRHLNHISTKEVRRLLNEFDIIYCPEGSFPKKGLAELIYRSSKILRKPLVGYLKSTHSDIRGLTTRNKGLDLLLVLSERDKEDCEKAGLSAVVLGAQRFKNLWIVEMSKYFSKHQECIRLKKSLLNKSVALILLKNRTGLVENNISVEAHLEYRRRIFHTLIEAGFHLLIKPHPSENSLPLEKTLETIPGDSYTISEIPAQYLAVLSLCSVCEMPSNSVIDSIAAGKKSYWPYRIIFEISESLSDDEVANRFVSSGFPENFFKFVEIKFPERKNGLSLDNDVRNQFERLVNTHIDIDNAISACEQAVLK